MKTSKRLSSTPGPNEPAPEDNSEGALVARGDTPLSFLAPAARARVARSRVRDNLTVLLNAVVEGAKYVSLEERDAYLVMVNVLHALLHVAGTRTRGAARALTNLDRAAMLVLREFAPEDKPLVPADHDDLAPVYRMKSSKLAFLNMIADALEQARIRPIEQIEDGRLDERRLQIAFAGELPQEDAGARASEAAARIVTELLLDEPFARLLVRPTNIATEREDRKMVSRGIAALMLKGNATVPQVAKVVLLVFGTNFQGLKNMFSKTLLAEWARSRTKRQEPALT